MTDLMSNGILTMAMTGTMIEMITDGIVTMTMTGDIATGIEQG